MPEQAAAPSGSGGPGVRADLADGTPVLLRMAAPGDGPRILDGFERCSIETRYFRFLSSGYRLTDARLAALTDADQADHVVWLGLDAGAHGTPVMAVARYVRSPVRSGTAEVAFIVADDYQGRGAGGLLFDALHVSADAHGIAVFEAEVLAENVAMKTLLLRRGARITGRSGPEVHMEVVLSDRPGGSGHGPVVAALRSAANRAAPTADGTVPPRRQAGAVGSTVRDGGD